MASNVCRGRGIRTFSASLWITLGNDRDAGDFVAVVLVVAVLVVAAAFLVEVGFVGVVDLVVDSLDDFFFSGEVAVAVTVRVLFRGDAATLVSFWFVLAVVSLAVAASCVRFRSLSWFSSSAGTAATLASPL